MFKKLKRSISQEDNPAYQDGWDSAMRCIEEINPNNKNRIAEAKEMQTQNVYNSGDPYTDGWVDACKYYQVYGIFKKIGSNKLSEYSPDELPF